ncbi:MAG: hypothetical protein IPP33_03735 [Flavobacteriales bacterium]|nr:hypothetical protein [Flavobacteriales bacterium]
MMVVDAAGSADELATKAIIDFSLTKNAMTLLLCYADVRDLHWHGTWLREARYRWPQRLGEFLGADRRFRAGRYRQNSIGEKHHMRFVPYLLTLFFFIWFLNLIG